MSEGQRKARSIQRVFGMLIVVMAIGVWRHPYTGTAMIPIMILLIALIGVIDAMRALALSKGSEG